MLKGKTKDVKQHHAFEETMTKKTKKALDKAQEMFDDNNILLQNFLGRKGDSWNRVVKALTAFHNVAGSSLLVVHETISDAEKTNEDLFAEIYHHNKPIEANMKEEWNRVAKALTTFYNVAAASLQVLEESLHDAYKVKDGELGNIDEKNLSQIVERMKSNKAKLSSDIKELHHIQRLLST